MFDMILAGCLSACPTGALARGDAASGGLESSDAARRTVRDLRGACRDGTFEPLTLDMGRCLFCGDCAAACPEGAIRFGRDWRMAARRREDLVVGDEGTRPAEALERRTRRLYGRSLAIRQVGAGGCNACESDSNALSTIGWDMGRTLEVLGAHPIKRVHGATEQKKPGEDTPGLNLRFI